MADLRLRLRPDTRLAAWPTARPPFRRVWRFRAAHYLEFPPAVAYGRVYVPRQQGRFFALDAATRKRSSGAITSRRCLASSPTVAEGVVYQGMMRTAMRQGGRSNARNMFVAMDARTGKIIWRLRTGVVESSPLLVDGRLYFGSWDNHLYAVRARDGKVLWRYKADGELNGAPAYADRTVFVGSHGGRVHAVDARTGRARWIASSFSRFGRREYFASPAVAYGRVSREHRWDGLRVRGRNRSAPVGEACGHLRVHGARRLAPARLRRYLRRLVVMALDAATGTPAGAGRPCSGPWRPHDAQRSRLLRHLRHVRAVRLALRETRAVRHVCAQRCHRPMAVEFSRRPLLPDRRRSKAHVSRRLDGSTRSFPADSALGKKAAPPGGRVTALHG